MNARPFAAGTTVFDTAGTKVGMLHTYDAQSGYLALRTGWLGRTQRYIHQSAVSRSDASGIVLQLSKGDLKATRYDFAWPQSADPPVGPDRTAAPAIGTPCAVSDGPRTSTPTSAQSTPTSAQSTPTSAQSAPPPAPVSRFAALDD